MSKTASGLPLSLLRPVAAEVRSVQAEWAIDCANLEQSGTRGYFLAAMKYQEQYAEGPSEQDIADAVTSAGFPLNRKTVNRRLQALATLDPSDVTSEPSTATLAAFAAAYHDANTAHVANNAGENEWYTPAAYIAAAVAVMGAIDLDPASTPTANEVVGAATIFTRSDDGLAQRWTGRVWMNPPYARPLIDGFCAKLAESYASGDVEQACVLTNNATETGWFHAIAELAGAIAFPRHRVKFWHPDREAVPLQGQAVTYLGANVERFREEFVRFGFTVGLA